MPYVYFMNTLGAAMSIETQQSLGSRGLHPCVAGRHSRGMEKPVFGERLFAASWTTGHGTVNRGPRAPPAHHRSSRDLQDAEGGLPPGTGPLSKVLLGS